MAEFDLETNEFTPVFWDKLRAELKSLNEPIRTQLDSIEVKLTGLAALEKSVATHKVEIDNIRQKTLPDMSQHMTELIAGCALQCLDLHMHHRKFALVIQGVKGERNETPEKTRKSIIDLARTELKVEAKEQDFAACHRNGPDAGSSIHARFVDLSTRDRFLANAKKLARSKQKGISISVDVPPCLRKVRKELADLRKGLPDERKRRSFIKHLPSWPYFQLQEKADDNVITVTKHSFSRETVALSALQSSMKELAGPLDFVIK